ncbi:integrase [Gossypium australe]|uniref:Integrase n=1 Tax=Gossypium australe TaxID=47621 RepID=A0A5B6UYM8_9ROSI|nr:integrase [Gossypium australe]
MIFDDCYTDDSIFEWPKKCQQSFKQLKALLTEAPVLVQPKSGKEFVIFSDVSLNGLGCVLMQEDKLRPHEKNYSTHDLELAAIKDLNLRQRIWLELLKDYELVIDYHSWKANIVADALSKKSLFDLRAMNTQLTLSDDGLVVAELKAKFKFAKLRNVTMNCKLKEYNANYQIGSDDCLLFQDRICVLRNSELIHKILHEAHSSCLSIHPGSTKMYSYLKQLYWWSGMKRDILEFVSKCLVCQQVKPEHQVPSGLLQPVMIPE